MINNNIKKNILGFAAYSGTGKTTLLINIIPLLKKKIETAVEAVLTLKAG